MQRSLLVASVVVAVALAGCIGSTAEDTSGPATPTSEDSPDQDPSKEAAEDNTTDPAAERDDDGPTQKTQDEPRTPREAMPDRDPAETGPGWVRFEVQGTAEFAVDNWYAQAGSCQEDYFGVPWPPGRGCSDRYNLTLQDDVQVVEVVLTWSSERADLNLHLLTSKGEELESSTHGQEFTDQLPADGTFAPNGTQWEYLDTSAAEHGAGEFVVEVSESNNWDAASLQGTLGTGDGLAYTLEVWVSTVDRPLEHRPDA